VNPALLNRDFQLPADGWFQIVPLGAWPVVVPAAGPDQEPQRLLQIIDQQAISDLAADFANRAQAPNFAGLLFDYDHFSMDTDHPSTAAGWITAVQPRATGLYAQVRWAPSGQAAVANGEYRFCSPVFARSTAADLGNGRLRPAQLLSVALTNDPNMKGMIPLSNRADTGAPSPTPPDNGRKDPRPMKEVLTLLGLPDTATETEAAAALKNRLTRLTELEATTAGVQADTDLKPFEALLADGKRDEVKQLLMANRDAGLKLLGALKPAPTVTVITPPAPLPNRKSAVLPTTAESAASQEIERAAKIRNRTCELQKALGISFRQAWEKAEAETPANVQS
jgi:phage I-like protein